MFYILFFYLKKWVNRSFPLLASDGSESLRSLTKNERPWGICSHRSEEISDREQIAQIAHQKWANEWIARFFEQIAHALIFGQKTSDYWLAWKTDERIPSPALGIVFANTWPCPPARHHSTAAVHIACPYMGMVGSILNEDPPPFPSRYVIYLWKQYLPYLAGRIFARAALHSPPGRWGLLALKQFIHCHFKETDLRSTIKFLKISFIIAILFLVCKMKLECSYINYYCMFLAELSCVKQMYEYNTFL